MTEPAGEVPLDSVDTRPLAISKPAPAYPAAAQRMRLEGDVELRVLVLESGAVGEVRIARSPSPVLGEAAKKAAATWRYRPAIRNGTLVRVWITETIEFKNR
jgi:protein TonB